MKLNIRTGPPSKEEKVRKREIEVWKETHDHGRAPVCLSGCANSTSGGSGKITIGPLTRTCLECGKQFYFVQGTFQNNGGLELTPYRNQKICPGCKKQEREKPLPRSCKWCKKEFVPKRRNDAKTCSTTCRNKLSDDRIKDKEL